jgi:DNA invertase Pin-like site-specific DNA recombinase
MTPPSEKVRPYHLDRVACIYVRQSTLAQVRHHHESTERQYGFVQRAEALGWPQHRVSVIDEDLGKSGASAEDRGGFQRLVAEVCLGQIGAVFGLEISRLARSCADWYRLLELCGVARTLIVDDDGIYDPTDFNDRLLLGLKGTISEIERHYLHQRLWGGKLHKARKGELALVVPLGFAYDAAGAIRLHPDEQVQQSFRLLFDSFAQRPSAHAVLRFFRDQALQVPSRREPGRSDSQRLWTPLSYGRVLSVLHNPCYAGAYFFGRRSERLAPPGRRSVRRPMAEWDVLLWQHHPGYIDRETFEMNQQTLARNQTNGPWVVTRGAVREGAALLQGLTLCGRCGRRMTIRYPGRARRQGLYLCDAARTRHAGRTCQAVLSPPIDAAVGRAFLAAVRPAQLRLALRAFAAIETERRRVAEQWQRQVERAQYEADRAHRQFDQVEPENRLVARTLEAEWNANLEAAERCRQEAQRFLQANPPSLTPPDRERITRLASDLPALWQHPQTTAQDRKLLLRTLVADITLTRDGLADQVSVLIRWKTGATSQLEVPHPTRGARTPAAVVERIRILAPRYSDAVIARLLNREGLHTGKGRRFNTQAVSWIRFAHHLPKASQVARRRTTPNAATHAQLSIY